MKTVRLALLLTTMIGVIIGLTPVAWAGGAGGDYGCCVVDNPGGGAIALDGTIALVYDETGLPNTDVKLRLVRGGFLAFFQLNLKGAIFGLSNEEIVCFVINPNEVPPRDADAAANKAAVNALVDEILEMFFPDSGRVHSNTVLVITRKSITLTDGNAGGEIETNRYAAIGDVKIYVIDPANANYEENSFCEPR